MIHQVIIGFATEGITDVRFLSSVIQRSFEDVAFECKCQIEILPIQHIERQSGDFVSVVQQYAYKADEMGVMVLCIHSDADATSDRHTFARKIRPAFTAVEKTNEQKVCRNLLPVVPVQMTEAWMLSDRDRSPEV